MARCTITAATALSTPPREPRTTSPVSPTSSFTFAISRSAMLSRLPVTRQTADVEDEVRQELLAAHRVADLGVELDPVEALLVVRDRRVDARLRRATDAEARGQRRDLVAVAHPHDGLGAEAGEELARVLPHPDLGVAELSLARALDRPAQGPAHPLHPVADAEDGDAHLEQALGDIGRVVGVDAGRAAREDDAGEVHLLGRRERLGRGEDLAPGPRLAQAARDELGVLGAEVDDQEAARPVRDRHEVLGRGPVGGRHGISRGGRSCWTPW